MNVSLNTVYNYNNVRFSGKAENQKTKEYYSDKEIKIAKTKKAVSECATIVVGLGILYFAIKRNFKINRIKNQEKKLKELASFVPPTIKFNPKDADEFLKV